MADRALYGDGCKFPDVLAVLDGVDGPDRHKAHECDELNKAR